MENSNSCLEKILIIEGSYEYNYRCTEEKDGTIIHELFYSSNPEWTEDFRGKLACSIVDDGNGHIINTLKKNMDYSEMSELKYLMDIAMALPKADLYTKVN